MLNSCFETTSAVLAERRLQILRNLAQSSCEGTACTQVTLDFQTTLEIVC
jgi:hypothetical protein